MLIIKIEQIFPLSIHPSPFENFVHEYWIVKEMTTSSVKLTFELFSTNVALINFIIVHVGLIFTVIVKLGSECCTKKDFAVMRFH